MKDVFTFDRFRVDCDAYLYLFQQMATKTLCEAVVEGMGSVWDKCASAERHPDFKTSVEEAVIAWSAPQPYHPEAVPFINHSLAHYFGRYDSGPLKGQLKPWNFNHVDQRTGRVVAQPGLVMARHRKDALRLPSATYNSSVA